MALRSRKSGDELPVLNLKYESARSWRRAEYSAGSIVGMVGSVWRQPRSLEGPALPCRQAKVDASAPTAALSALRRG